LHRCYAQHKQNLELNRIYQKLTLDKIGAKNTSFDFGALSSQYYYLSSWTLSQQSA
jgi:hypothetical protein